MFSCKKEKCTMIRYDVPNAIKYIHNSDTIFFNAHVYTGKAFEKTPFDPAPQALKDTLIAMYNNGYMELNIIAKVTDYVNCEDCQRVLKYNPRNKCYPL